AVDDPQGLQGRGHSQEARDHDVHPRPVPPGRAHPGAGDQRRGRQGGAGFLQRLEHPRLPEPVQRRRPVAHRAVCAGDHAVHHRLDHPAAADGRRAVAGEAAEGGRGRPAADHAVHALPHRRTRLRPVDRLRVPLPLVHRERRPADHRQLQRGARLLDRHLADGRLRADHVDGRAHHTARDRQRDLADDLRVDRLRTAQRRAGLGDEPRPGLQGHDAVHRARGDRSDRVRAGRPAADPDPVRKARDRPAHDLRRTDLPAAAREHGRRHPGHLRRIDHGLPADRRPAAQQRVRPRLRRVLLAQRLGLHRRRVDLHRAVHVLLHGGHVQPRRPGREPQEVRRLHPGRAARQADGRVPRSRARAADVPRRAVPRRRRRDADDPDQPDERELLLRRHVDPDRGRRRAGHHEAARGAADDARLRGLPEV
ncbi:MAG: Protein translocase subunit SecY, partial [uncultured Solirubrobacteraceae bacterium]